jgi:serine/threonine-protein kinase RsbT
MDVHTALLEILKRHLSPITAQSILARALREHALSPGDLTVADVRVLAPRLQAAVRLFVDPKDVEPFTTALREIGGDTHPLEALLVRVRTERDLSDLLAETRRICKALRIRPILLQRIATLVSELGRNIVSYTQGGTVELRPMDGEPPRLLIRAADSGPGIDNLDEIMAGKYRSKTGLGRGILGSQRLADRFDIRSGPGGTVIEAELRL